MTANSKGPREDAVGSGDGEYDPTANAPEYQVPEGLTVQETLEWVSDDKIKAKAALDAEQKRDHPRSGVVGPLEVLVNDETGAGIASGEA